MHLYRLDLSILENPSIEYKLDELFTVESIWMTLGPRSPVRSSDVTEMGLPPVIHLIFRLSMK